MSDENVKGFVRNILGCDCDEEVFKHIENERGASVAGFKLKNKINVGNRLLVYIAGTADLQNEMPDLIKAGREERDARGFNRFRLVLVSDDEGMKKRAFTRFKGLPDIDEKVHLHVIGKEGVARL